MGQLPLISVMRGFKKYTLVILSFTVSIVRSQLPQYGSNSGSGTPIGTVGALPVNIGINSGDSRQGSGGFSGSSGSSSSGSIGNGGGGGFSGGGGGGGGGGGDHQGLDWLRDALPGEPDLDYPIYSLPPPESSFSCNGRVEGGYYADTELRCQAFQICVHDSVGGLVKFSFLCPNGSLFDQQYFICDFWFNVDCAQAESFYFLNDEIAAERESNIGAVAPESDIGLALGRGGQGQVGGNSFNGRGSSTGNVGGSSSNGRGSNSGSSSNNAGGGNIQTLYGAPRPGRDLIEGGVFDEYVYQDDMQDEIENDIEEVIGLIDLDV